MANWVGLLTLAFSVVVTYLVSIEKYQRDTTGGNDPENGDIHFSLVASSQGKQDKQDEQQPLAASQQSSYSSTTNRSWPTHVELNGGKIADVNCKK